MLVAAALICIAALWVGTVVFGSAEQQLRVLQHTIDALYISMAAVPQSAIQEHPARRLIRTGTAFGAIAAAGAVAAAMGVLLAERTNLGAVPIIISIALVAATFGGAQAAVAAYLRDSARQPWGGAVSAWTYIAAVTTPVIAVGTTVPPVITTAMTVSYAAPILAAVLLPRHV